MIPRSFLLVDSNFLRAPDLRAYLSASEENAIAIDHLVLFEIFKKNPLLTGQESLRIAADFRDQVYVLRPTHFWLHAVITDDDKLGKLIDPEATDALRDLCQGLFITPPSNEVISQVSARQAEATHYINRMIAEIREYDDALRERAASFTVDQLNEIRTGRNVSDKTRKKISDLLHEITGEFILANVEPTRKEPLPTRIAVNMFAFRYALCVVLFYLEWIRMGRSFKSLTKRLNDVIDLQIATVSTFFSGVASNDTMTLTIAREAASILANWGAFIRFADR